MTGTQQPGRPHPGPTVGRTLARSARPAVVLVGAPGSGKSTVGAAIARMTGLPFRDTDADIERTAARPISQIFLEDGEESFRGLERAAVAMALAEHRGVLSLGGGAVLSPQTRTNLAGHAVAFLSVSMPNGVRRTGLGANRPLLAGLNPRATYKALLQERVPAYLEIATLVVDTDDRTVAEVAKFIIETLELK